MDLVIVFSAKEEKGGGRAIDGEKGKKTNSNVRNVFSKAKRWVGVFLFVCVVSLNYFYYDLCYK